MGKWLEKFSAERPVSRTDTADIVGERPAVSAMAVPHPEVPATPAVPPPLRPGWRIVYRDHQWRLAGGSDDPEHGTVDVCWKEQGVWQVRLTDGQQIPLSRVRSVAAIDDKGRCSAAWTVREHGYDGQGSCAPGMASDVPDEPPAIPAPLGTVLDAAVDWRAAWRELAALTYGITAEDPRFAGVMAALHQCDEAYRNDHDAAFRQVAKQVRSVVDLGIH